MTDKPNNTDKDRIRKKRNMMFAQASLSPLLNAGTTLEMLIPQIRFSDREDWKASRFDIANALRKQVRTLRKGDLSRPEDMLLSQAHTLDQIFNNEIRRAMGTDKLDVFKAIMDIALKAQRQCRATIETLAFIKNPQPYIRQQNMALNQQVNNGPPISPSHAPRMRAGKSKSQNELLEAHDDARMDAAAMQAAGRADQELEAVGTQHRPED